MHFLLNWGGHTKLIHNRELWSWSATVSSDFNVLQFKGQWIMMRTNVLTHVAPSQLPIEIAQKPTIFTMVQEQIVHPLKHSGFDSLISLHYNV